MTVPAKQPWVRRDAQPFQVGNTAALRSGVRATTSRVLDARAAQVRAEMEVLAETHPWAATAHPSVVELFCKAVAKMRMINDYIDSVVEGDREAFPSRDRPSTGIEAVPPYLWTEATRAEAQATKLAERLGLDPKGQAELMKDSAWAKRLAGASLDELMAAGRRVRTSREAAARSTPAKD